MRKNPKVFVSHASEDKNRFVIGFAEKLRTKGIDAWLDQWEMYPGDSLVDKIFNEGLKNAEAFIIILSSNSVEKPWVKEELNAGFINKIKKGIKIIPLVIDECSIPEPLQSTVWERIENIDSYEQSFDSIVASIYGFKDKPPLGKSPEYVSEEVKRIPGLTKLDVLVLKLSCAYAIRENEIILDTECVFEKNMAETFPEHEIKESLEVLHRRGYIDLTRELAGGRVYYQLKTFGLQEYATAYIEDYSRIKTLVVASLVNNESSTNFEIQEQLKLPALLINHVLELLELNDYVRLSRMTGEMMRISHISPELKRALS